MCGSTHSLDVLGPSLPGLLVANGRVSARKKFMGGQLENTNLLKKGICLLNTFLKDFTKMPIKKNTVLQFDGGISPPCQNHEGDKSPPSPPLYETLNGD